MRLLCLSLSAAAFGETFIGLTLAGQLRAAGFETHFVVPPATRDAARELGFPHTVLDYDSGPKGEDARTFFDQVVKEVRPDALILADYCSYYRSVQFHLGIDPWFIEEYGIPILPIDLGEWDRTTFEIDLCGRGPVPVSRKILEFPAHLRPVPTAHLDGGERGFPYRLMAREPEPDRRNRSQVFTELGLRGTDRLVMLPMSSWQQPAGGRGMSSDMGARLTERVPELVAHYLGELPAATHVLVVGEAPPALTRLGDRLHVVPPCATDRYTRLMGASDAVIVFSPTSATAARAVLRGIPAMVLQNRFTVHDADQAAAAGEQLGGLTGTVRDWLRAAAPIDPFRLWPKGAYFVQEPMFTDNEYNSALLTGEILDERGTVATLEGVLYDAGAQARWRAAQQRYTALVDALPPAHETVRAAARRAGA
jgi:hypothetical protein